MLFSYNIKLHFQFNLKWIYIIQIEMRFKIRGLQTQAKHEEICTSVSWCSSNQVTSLGEDNVIYKWNVNTNENIKFIDLDSYAVDHDWVPLTKGVSDLVAVGFADGSFKLYNKNGKLQKNVADAHKKSITSVKWSYDGSALATSSQDGSVKIWSKNGSLRTNLIQTDRPIYSITWSPESDGILYCSDKSIFLKPISANQQKQLQWKAHEGLILKLDWSPSNNCIISCGEDCKYKVWDSYGRLLYSSAPYDYVVTSVAWSPNGEYFSVGAFGMLKLCDKTGWTYSFNKTQCGSAEKITWSPDGTLCSAACGDGSVIFAQVVDKKVSFNNWEANLNDQNRIIVTDILNQINEYLEFKDRVINMSIGYNDLIVTTANQCYIYNFSNWNTPHIFDLKDSVSFILQSPKYFCLIENTNGIMVYNYDGKLVSNPKITGAKFQFMNRKRIALSPDILAVIETTNNKLVRFFEIASGKPINFTLQHSLSILQINLNQTEQSLQRKITFIDVNRDLYLAPIHKSDKSAKLGAICDSFIWHDKFDILTSISDSKLQTYFYPNVVYVDKSLFQATVNSKEATQLGRMPQILNYSGSQVTVRRKDGSIVSLGVSPYPTLLFDFCEKGKWEKAMKLCRFVKEPLLWACLAAISLKVKQLDTAETAFAAIQQPEKVSFISQIRESPSQIVKNATMALLLNKPNEAEQIYVQNKYYFLAIEMHINAYRWERALKLARDYKTCLDIVVGLRKKYLKRIGKEETNKQLIKAAQEVGEVNLDNLAARIEEQKGKKK